jgi:large subunit ribosomal protein L35
MPKFKPNKGVLKRVRVTRNGKVVVVGAGTEHRMANKNAKRKRRMKRHKPLSNTAAREVKRLIGLR